jgi:hypothetical protein
MRRKDFVLAAAAATVLAVLNPAFAGDSSYDASRSAGVETNDQLATKADSAKAMEEGAPSDQLERNGEARLKRPALSGPIRSPGNTASTGATTRAKNRVSTN